MFSTSDTIVAIATPPGRGGIGVVRLSGPGAAKMASGMTTAGGLEPRHATHTYIMAAGRALDEAIATYFPAPRSYTGEDVVELSAHGSPVVLEAIVARAISLGARLAEPGEFTLRAFLNGRIDLPQAEAVADLIDAVTPLQARAAFDQLQGTLTNAIGGIDAALFDLIARLEASIDFPDEGYHFAGSLEVAQEIARLRDRTSALVETGGRGRLVREGLQVAIIGRPNVGKSSLFNALLGVDRAIVSDLPGTTRDLVSEAVSLHGVPVTFFDTAGIRPTANEVEAEGVVRARRAESVADLSLVVLDASVPSENPDLGQTTESILVWNKIDLVAPEDRCWRRAGIGVSALTGEGLVVLTKAIVAATGDGEPHRDTPAITNVRHLALVGRADAALGRAHAAASAEPPAPEELVLADLQEARMALEEVTGGRAADDLLAHIFSRFCVGK